MTIVGTLLLVLAVGFAVAANVIGSYVDANGSLHEAFALIPLAWLAGLSGIVLIAVAAWRRRRD